MITLYKNHKPSYCSEIVEHNDNKFKIVSENGNCYCYLNIYVFTSTGELAQIANRWDIQNSICVSYILDKDRRLAESIRNIELAKEFILAIYK